MRKILLGLVSVGLLFSQGNQTIYAPIFSNKTTLGLSANVTNIGQSTHFLFVTFTNTLGHSCAIQDPSTLYITIEGSFDNSFYTGVGSAITSSYFNASGQLVGTTQAIGAYPYIRVNYLKGDTTNCKITASYSGAIPSAAYPAAITAGVSNYLTATAISHSAIVTPITPCPPSGVPNNFTLYGMSIYSETTQDVGISTQAGAVALFKTVPNAWTMVWPTSSVPYFRSGSGTIGNCLAMTTTGTGYTQVNVTYRIE